MNDPLITIITPIYNSSQYLEACIRSILMQTYDNFELICINDYSTDNSLDILKTIADSDPRVLVIENKEKKGVSYCRNQGLENAHGDFYAFVDSDDIVDKNFLSLLLNRMNNTNVDIVYCTCKKITENGTAIDGVFYKTYDNDCIVKANQHLTKMILGDVGGYLWLGLYKSNLWNNIRFSNHNILEDLEVHLKVLLNADTVFFFDNPLYYYRINYRSLTHLYCLNNFYDSFVVMKEKHFLSLSLYGDVEMNRRTNSMVTKEAIHGLFHWYKYILLENKEMKEMSKWIRTNKETKYLTSREKRMRFIFRFFKPLFIITARVSR